MEHCSIPMNDGIEMVWKQRSGTDHNAVDDDDGVLVNDMIQLIYVVNKSHMVSLHLYAAGHASSAITCSACSVPCGSLPISIYL